MGKLSRMMSGRSVAAAQSQHLGSQESSRVGSSVDGQSQEQSELWPMEETDENAAANLDDLESGVWHVACRNRHYPNVRGMDIFA